MNKKFKIVLICKIFFFFSAVTILRIFLVKKNDFELIIFLFIYFIQYSIYLYFSDSHFQQMSLRNALKFDPFLINKLFIILSSI
jgi:hypothetical protein